MHAIMEMTFTNRERERSSLYQNYHQVSGKPEVGDVICNTVTMKIPTSTKASQPSTNIFLVN